MADIHVEQLKVEETKLLVKKSVKKAKAKAQKMQVYKHVDVKEFIITEKNNPYNSYDCNKQKISINPGVQYRSTS